MLGGSSGPANTVTEPGSTVSSSDPFIRLINQRVQRAGSLVDRSTFQAYRGLGPQSAVSEGSAEDPRNRDSSASSDPSVPYQRTLTQLAQRGLRALDDAPAEGSSILGEPAHAPSPQHPRLGPPIISQPVDRPRSPRPTEAEKEAQNDAKRKESTRRRSEAAKKGENAESRGKRSEAAKNARERERRLRQSEVAEAEKAGLPPPPSTRGRSEATKAKFAATVANARAQWDLETARAIAEDREPPPYPRALTQERRHKMAKTMKATLAKKKADRIAGTPGDQAEGSSKRGKESSSERSTRGPPKGKKAKPGPKGE